MRPRRQCAVIAHRGGAREVPENTWSAVEHVVSLGLEWMETDLRATADDVVVLSHDAGLGRVSGMERSLSEMTWDEAAELETISRMPARVKCAELAWRTLEGMLAEQV